MTPQNTDILFSLTHYSSRSTSVCRRQLSFSDLCECLQRFSFPLSIASRQQVSQGQNSLNIVHVCRNQSLHLCYAQKSSGMYNGCPLNGLSSRADENFPKRLNGSVMIATPLVKIQSLKTLENGFMDDSNTKVSKKINVQLFIGLYTPMLDSKSHFTNISVDVVLVYLIWFQLKFRIQNI